MFPRVNDQAVPAPGGASSDRHGRGASRRATRSAEGRAARRAGFNYIEVGVSVVILGTAIAAALNLYGSYVRASVQGTQSRAALDLAQDLMTEILSQSFEEPGTTTGSFGKEAGESTRANFDDVDDYAGWSETPPAARDATPLTGTDYSKITRSVRVWNVDLSDMSTVVSNGSSPAKAIEVKVTIGGKVRASLFSHRTRFVDS